MNSLEIREQALMIGTLCANLYTTSPSACQWQTHYVSVTGEWEWHFWT